MKAKTNKFEAEPSQPEVVNINSDGSVDSTLDATPDQLPPVEDIIINLGFWLDMLHRVAPRVLQSRLNGVPKSEPDKE